MLHTKSVADEVMTSSAFIVVGIFHFEVDADVISHHDPNCNSNQKMCQVV